MKASIPLTALIILITISTHSYSRASSKCDELQKLQILPGNGWNIIQGNEMGQITTFSYSHCKTTDDGLYLIPDQIIAKRSDRRYPALSSDFDLDSVIPGTQDFNQQTTAPAYTIATKFLQEMKLSVEFEFLINDAAFAIDSDDLLVNEILENLVRYYGTHIIVKIDVKGVEATPLMDSDELEYIKLPENFEIINRTLIQLDQVIKYTSPEISSKSLAMLALKLRHTIRNYLKSNSSNNKSMTDHKKLADYPNHNYTFGGLFQRCNSSLTELGDLCGNLTQRNPLTGDFSCPQNYFPFNLRNANVEQKYCSDKCYSIKGQMECKNVCFQSQSTYEAFWCAAIGTVTNNSGLMFGGLYSAGSINPITGSFSCPQYFVVVSFLQDLHVCIGNDYTAQQTYGFGGFFSCTNGNPLSSIVDAQEIEKDEENGDPYRHECPSGTTQLMAAVDQECLINYCSSYPYLSSSKNGILHDSGEQPQVQIDRAADEGLVEKRNFNSIEFLSIAVCVGSAVFAAFSLAGLIWLGVWKRQSVVSKTILDNAESLDECEDDTSLLIII